MTTGGGLGGSARSEATGQLRPAPKPQARRFPVRLKLVAVLFLPVTLLLAFAATRVQHVRQEARDAQAEARLATAVTGPGSLLDLLIDERNFSAAYLVGAEEAFSGVESGGYLETRAQVDDAIVEFRAFIEEQGEEVQQIYAPALDVISAMTDLRMYVDAEEGPHTFDNMGAVQDLFERFDEVIGPLFEANQRVSIMVTDPALRNATAIVDRSLRQANTQALLLYEVSLASIAGDRRGLTSSETLVPTAMLLRDLQMGDRVIRLNAEGELREHVDALLSSEHIQTFSRLIAEALETGEPNVLGIFEAAQGEGAPEYRDLRIAAEEEIDEVVAGLDRDARMTQWYFVVSGVAVLVVLSLVTALVALSITRPLRSLTRLAMGMANERLPGAVREILEAPPGEDVAVPAVPPIEIRTRDEVADVARALSTVQDSALTLAAEQAALRRNIADSFVNLGRRNQALLGRQLDFITELERNETDAEALSNLFRLDHLATRMRRNAESLLVLAGIDPPRRWASPVRLTDVIRASLGEVEDYQRVAIQGVEPATIVGSAAADLAHLLAELIENALTFSPPGKPVEVRGTYAQGASAAGAQAQAAMGQSAYTLTITDFGVGMSDENIARANLRLVGQESFTVAPSKFLGHYVAGMIAARHGIEVELGAASPRGLTATVGLPPELLSREEAVGAVEPPVGAATAAATAIALNPSDGAPSPIPAEATGRGRPAPFVPAQAPAGVTVSGGPTQPGGTVDTYRVGNTEFHIDRGIAMGQPSRGYGDYAQVIQQVQGAQMQETGSVGSSRDGSSPVPPGGQATPGGSGEDENERRARHVHSFLSNFSTGLEQGRDAAARGEPQRDPGTSPPPREA